MAEPFLDDLRVNLGQEQVTGVAMTQAVQGDAVPLGSYNKKPSPGVGSRTVTASRLRNTVSRKDGTDGGRTRLMER